MSDHTLAKYENDKIKIKKLKKEKKQKLKVSVIVSLCSMIWTM